MAAVRRIKCMYCVHVSLTPKEANRHWTKCHKPKPVPKFEPICPVCNRVFIYEGPLIKHVFEAHPDVEYDPMTNVAVLRNRQGGGPVVAPPIGAGQNNPGVNNVGAPGNIAAGNGAAFAGALPNPVGVMGGVLGGPVAAVGPHGAGGQATNPPRPARKTPEQEDEEVRRVLRVMRALQDQ